MKGCNMNQKILRLRAVQDWTGLSRSTIYAMLKTGNFPQSVKLGLRSAGWYETEISNWINSHQATQGGFVMNNDPPKSKATERTRIVNHLRKYYKLTTIDSREWLGIMNPAQRISELIKKGAPIGKDYTMQTDSTGARHRVRVYIWLGEHSAQGDFFGYQFSYKYPH